MRENIMSIPIELMIIWVSFSQMIQLGMYDIYVHMYVYLYVPIVHSGEN